MASEKGITVTANKKRDWNKKVEALAGEKFMELSKILYFGEMHGDGHHWTPKDLYWRHLRLDW